MKWTKAIAVLIAIILMFGLVGNLDYKQQQRASEWHASVQAIELEQEKMQADIIRIRERLIAAEQELRVQNGLIWDIRDRVHLDLELELEGEN